MADFINDRLHVFPALHRGIKSLFAEAVPSETAMPQTVKSSHTAAGEGSESPPTVEEQAQVVEPSEAEQPTISPDSLPIPPLEMRELVGPTDLEAFDNPTGALVFDYMEPKLDARVYERVFDFGCGCGRLARQMMQQRPRPKQYVGIDIHQGMIRWCQRNLQTAAPNFRFFHHDVFNVRFNPKSTNSTAPFPVTDERFSLVIAHSVFTHLTELQAVHYLRECARILDEDGVLYASWFVFDKKDYPMMNEYSNALYVSYEDPSAAVTFDRQWVRNAAHEAGLKIFAIAPPWVRGHQWALMMTPRQDVSEPEFPADLAPRRSMAPPMGSGEASLIGMETK